MKKSQKKLLTGIVVTLLIIVIIILVLYFVGVFNNKKSKSITSTNNQKKVYYNGSGNKIIATWSSLTTCGRDYFDIISLASALPQNYDQTNLDTFFTANIQGDYDKNMSTGKTKYLISIGGSNASPQGWTTMLNLLSTDSGLKFFYDECQKRGIVGCDWDLEGTTNTMTPLIASINKKLKTLDPNFIIMLTILLGSPETFSSLLNNPNDYDYLSLMLYNGGMYQKDNGAGCMWNEWAELILSKGTTGCDTPLMESREAYANSANLSQIKPEKVLLGLIVDTIGNRLNQNIFATANQLITKYNGGGLIYWVLPGWVKQDNINVIEQIYGGSIKCHSSGGGGGGGGDTCSKPDKPCDGSCQCVASPCGKRIQGVTDDNCAPCPGQSWWPCNETGFCQCKN